LELVSVLGVHERLQPGALQPASIEAGRLTEPGVDAQEPPALRAERYERAPERGVVERAAELRLRAGSSSAAAGVAGHVPGDGRQALQVVLADEVGGPFADQGGGGLLTDRARNDDQRDVAAPRARQRAQGAE